MALVAFSSRRVLCVAPRYEPSFGSFHHAYPVMGGVAAFMPPLGLLTLAAYLPGDWQIRFVDESLRPTRDDEYRWAEIVLTTGMHVQRRQIAEIARRARAAGAASVLGGPSVSAAPDWYPEFDYLHLGELGDATDELLVALESCPAPLEHQIRFETRQRLPLEAFPIPAWHLVPLHRYFIIGVQASSGCPYRCEFCDIPGLYGRVPRLKTPEQIEAELDAVLAQAAPAAIYFVDDNFIGNRRATKALLPALINWQRRHFYPVQFACEATLNLARDPELLALMRDAFFCTVFCGIESPDARALLAMEKGHNLALPLLDAVAILNRHGIEIVSGIILGLDTDGPETAKQIVDFAAVAHIPMLTVNLLHALPGTPLWTRLESEGRLLPAAILEAGRESNIEFRLPYDAVLSAWRRCVAELYRPEALWSRLAWNARHTYPNRLHPVRPKPKGREARRGLQMVARLLWRVGVRADWRWLFWRHAVPLLRQGRLREVLHMAVLACHLISFARMAVAGTTNAAFYAPKTKQSAEPAA